MPEVSMRYLVEILIEVGPVQSTGFGVEAVTEERLRAWQDNRHIELPPWEITMVRRLSQEYIRASAEAEEPGAPAPYKSNIDIVRANTAASLKAAMRRLA